MKKITLKFVMMLIAAFFVTGQSYAQNEIAGTVLYHFKNNKPISSVTVTLTGQNTGYTATTVTDLNGGYSFTEVPTDTYTIEASTNIMPGGINMADAQKVRHHLIGNQTLDEFEQLAADVDGIPGIGWGDYDAIVAWHMQGTPFSTDPWVFQSISGIEHTYTSYKNLTNVPTMGGSSSGDVNGTFVPTTRDYAMSQINYTEKSFSNDFTVEVYANDIEAASAMGLILNFPEKMVNISNITSPLGEIMTNLKNGKVRIGWINGLDNESMINSEIPVLVISGATTPEYDGSDIQFTLDPGSHFSDKLGNELTTRYTMPVLKRTEGYLGNNYPNPFSSHTTIDYDLPADSKVNISLYNQQGQLVTIIAEDVQKAGKHSVNFESGNLQSGIYYYILKTNGTVQINETKRMIITR